MTSPASTQPGSASPQAPVRPAGMAVPLGRASFSWIEFLRYFLVSALALGLDAGLLLVLVERAGWHYLPAAMLGFVGGSLLAFALSACWAFRRRSFQRWHDGFLVFAVIGLLGLVVNMAILWLGTEGLGLHYMLAKALAAACSFGLNFLLRKLALFS